MFEELEAVVLNKNIARYHLKRGDVGTIVHVYESGKAYEIEFITSSGRTIAVLTLSPKDIRSIEAIEKSLFCGDWGNLEFTVLGTTSNLDSRLQTNRQSYETVARGYNSTESSFCYPTI